MAENKNYGAGFGMSPLNRFKLTAEVVAAAGLTIVATGALPNSVSNIVDFIGVGIPLIEFFPQHRKMRKINQEIQNMRVSEPFEWGAENWVAGEDTMARKIRKWRDEEHGPINKRIADSKAKEFQDIAHFALYSSLILAGRSALQILSNIPHSGDGFRGVWSSVEHATTSPDLLGSALHDFVSNPGLASEQTGLVVGAIIATSLWNWRRQSRITAKLNAKNRAIDSAARDAERKYVYHKHLNAGEKIFKGLHDLPLKLLALLIGLFFKRNRNKDK